MVTSRMWVKIPLPIFFLFSLGTRLTHHDLVGTNNQFIVEVYFYLYYGSINSADQNQ